MRETACLLTLLLAVLVCVLPAAPAQAQETRTFVSEAGSDTNSCTSAAAPCRHFKAAYAATPAGGEIDVLDPANYGSLTITGPIRIQGHGWASSSAAGGEPVFTINAGTNDEINIRGVVLDGIGVTGSIGIQFNSGGNLNVQDSVIRNFDSLGIAFVPNGTSALFVSNTLISDLANANGTGINIAPSGGSVTAAARGRNASGSNTTAEAMFTECCPPTTFDHRQQKRIIAIGNGARGHRTRRSDRSHGGDRCNGGDRCHGAGRRDRCDWAGRPDRSDRRDRPGGRNRYRRNFLLL